MGVPAKSVIMTTDVVNTMVASDGLNVNNLATQRHTKSPTRRSPEYLVITKGQVIRTFRIVLKIPFELDICSLQKIECLESNFEKR